MFLTVALALLLQAGNPGSQPSSRVPITVALTDSVFEGDTKAILLHQAGGGDIIVVSRKTANPHAVAAALALFYARRGEYVANPTQSYRFAVHSMGIPPGWSKTLIPSLAKALAHLKNAQASQLDGAGTASSMQMWVPILVPTKG